MDAAVVFLVFAGWPLAAFAHYHFRRGFPTLRALFLTIAPGLGAIFVELFFNEGVTGSRRSSHVLMALCGALGLLWLVFPYFLLAVWAVQAFRKGRSKSSSNFPL